MAGASVESDENDSALVPIGTYRPSRAASAVALPSTVTLPGPPTLMMPSSRRARNGPLLSAGTSLSSMVFVTGITPPMIMRSMWLNVRLTSSGVNMPEMWYSSRSFAVSAVGMMLGWLACRVSNFMILSSGVFAGDGDSTGLATARKPVSWSGALGH